MIMGIHEGHSRKIRIRKNHAAPSRNSAANLDHFVEDFTDAKKTPGLGDIILFQSPPGGPVVRPGNSNKGLKNVHSCLHWIVL